MSSNLLINRALGDRHMDDLDHALGRPAFPMLDGSRNHFAVDQSSPAAVAMLESPCWAHSGARFGMDYFSVTPEGRAALDRYLDHSGLRYGAPNLRPYKVTYAGHERTVIASSPSRAKYQYFCQVSDLISARFIELARQLKVKLA
jgi:hypothetical protein